MAFLWFINGGDPNHLLTGMILQVGTHFVVSSLMPGHRSHPAGKLDGKHGTPRF